MTAPLAAVVLCAGKGTRMKSEKAKVLHPILGRPLCAYPLKRALELGASPVVPVVGHQAAEVEKAIRAQLPHAPAALRAPEGAAGHGGRGALGGGARSRTSRAASSSSTETCRCCAARRWRRWSAAHEKGGGPCSPWCPPCWRTPPATAASSARVARWCASSSTRTPPRSSARCASATPASTWWSPPSSGRRWPRSAPPTRRASTTSRTWWRWRRRRARWPPWRPTPRETAGVNDRVELAARARVLQQRINERHMRAASPWRTRPPPTSRRASPSARTRRSARR